MPAARSFPASFLHSCRWEDRLPNVVKQPALLARLLGMALRARLRGSTRATFVLARRLQSLQSVPITVNDHQVLYVDLRDGLSHVLLAGSPWHSVPWERDEQEVMRRFVRPGDVVLDIGAHVGLHLVLLAELVRPGGHVHAFEPNPRKIRTLASTVANLPNATLHAVALADERAAATLFVPEDESMASLSDWTGGRVGPVNRTACRAERLDDLLESIRVPQPVFVKCDVEGSEFRVLSGARRTLDREDAPVVLYEANGRSAHAFGLPISAATDLLRSLPEARYSIYHVQEGARLRPIDEFDPGCDHFNLVAVPASKASRMSGGLAG